MGVHWKIQFLGWWGGHEKTVYRDIAENGGLRQFAELRRGLAKKKGLVFLRWLIPQCTLWLLCNASRNVIKISSLYVETIQLICIANQLTGFYSSGKCFHNIFRVIANWHEQTLNPGLLVDQWVKLHQTF